MQYDFDSVSGVFSAYFVFNFVAEQKTIMIVRKLIKTVSALGVYSLDDSHRFGVTWIIYVAVRNKLFPEFVFTAINSYTWQYSTKEK